MCAEIPALESRYRIIVDLYAVRGAGGGGADRHPAPKSSQPKSFVKLGLLMGNHLTEVT